MTTVDFVSKLEGFENNFSVFPLPFVKVFDNSEWAAHALVHLLDNGFVTKDQVKSHYKDDSKEELVEKFCTVRKEFLMECECGCDHYFYNVEVALK